MKKIQIVCQGPVSLDDRSRLQHLADVSAAEGSSTHKIRLPASSMIVLASRWPEDRAPAYISEG